MSFTVPLLVWLGAQLLALSLSAARIKLWAQFPAAGETLALDELIVAQFLASSLSFPYLCRNRRTTIAIALSSLPMIALAGHLSFAPMSTCIACAINLAIWLMSLAVWRKAASLLSADLIAVALVSTWNLAGVALLYFRAESGGPFEPFAAVPMLAAIRIGHSMSMWDFLPNLLCFAAAVVTLRILHARFSTAVMH